MSAEPSSGTAGVCASDTDERAAGGCCGGSGAGAGCGLSALRRSPGPRPTVTVAEETPLPATGVPNRRAEAPAGASAQQAEVPAVGASVQRVEGTLASAGAGRVGWLVADSVWWGGRLRTGIALRVAPDGVIRPVPAEMAPSGEDTRRFPGTLLPGLVDAHVHSALVDLTTVRAGGIAEVWDLGGVPAVVSELAERAGRAGSSGSGL
ncbi:MAG TPA: hypothetical protein VN408_08630, partial [Actinoplanes sp.]|nr:hypothetical protein [Actinoplanes sp.]